MVRGRDGAGGADRDDPVRVSGGRERCDRARDDLWLQVGSDDQAEVSLNGREIYRCPVPRPLETLDTVGPVSLKEGTNVLWLKVANEESTWEGTARLVDDAGRLLGVHEISDDPGGYAELGSLLSCLAM